MKYVIATLGCKVNQYETQAMEEFLTERGFERRRHHTPAAAHKKGSGSSPDPSAILISILQLAVLCVISYGNIDIFAEFVHAQVPPAFPGVNIHDLVGK